MSLTRVTFADLLHCVNMHTRPVVTGAHNLRDNHPWSGVNAADPLVDFPYQIIRILGVHTAQ
ncbi:hypothetical protein Hanom_Chr02g00127451 [Helianthus anomalus]